MTGLYFLRDDEDLAGLGCAALILYFVIFWSVVGYILWRWVF
jgi:hypothetical protein